MVILCIFPLTWLICSKMNKFKYMSTQMLEIHQDFCFFRSEMYSKLYNWEYSQYLCSDKSPLQVLYFFFFWGGGEEVVFVFCFILLFSCIYWPLENIQIILHWLSTLGWKFKVHEFSPIAVSHFEIIQDFCFLFLFYNYSDMKMNIC